MKSTNINKSKSPTASTEKDVGCIYRIYLITTTYNIGFE